MVPAGSIGANNDSKKATAIPINYALEFFSDDVRDVKRGICKKTGKPFYTQRAYGTLSLFKVENGAKMKILDVQAISESNGMGAIPNTEYAPGQTMRYFCGHLESPSSFHDGKVQYDKNTLKILGPKEHSWKTYIYEDFVNRGDFRIHPTPENSGVPMSNDGCISPVMMRSVFIM